MHSPFTPSPFLVPMALALALAFALGPGSQKAEAWTLDELYRDSLRQEHDGALPGFVINRGHPRPPEPQPLTPDERAARAAAARGSSSYVIGGEPRPWLEVVREVASGNPGPFAVDAVRHRAEGGDPQAVELLAWMTANGVGVRRDLPNGFRHYLRAAELGVNGARENAEAIFRVLSPEQRRALGYTSQ